MCRCTVLDRNFSTFSTSYRESTLFVSLCSIPFSMEDVDMALPPIDPSDIELPPFLSDHPCAQFLLQDHQNWKNWASLATDPIAGCRILSFLSSRRNSFPLLKVLILVDPIHWHRRDRQVGIAKRLHRTYPSIVGQMKNVTCKVGRRYWLGNNLLWSDKPTWVFVSACSLNCVHTRRNSLRVGHLLSGPGLLYRMFASCSVAKLGSGRRKG